MDLQGCNLTAADQVRYLSKGHISPSLHGRYLELARERRNRFVVKVNVKGFIGEASAGGSKSGPSKAHGVRRPMQLSLAIRGSLLDRCSSVDQLTVRIEERVRSGIVADKRRMRPQPVGRAPVVELVGGRLKLEARGCVVA